MGVAAVYSALYVALASTLDLLNGILLLLSHLLQMGYLTDFLSRTVMIGLPTGVGIDIAIGEIAGILNLPGGGRSTIEKLFNIFQHFSRSIIFTMD